MTGPLPEGEARRPWPLLGGVVLLVTVLAVTTRDWPADNRIEVWSSTRGGATERIIERHFGGDRFVVLRWTAEAADAPDRLEWLAARERDLIDDEAVVDHLSPLSWPLVPAEGLPWSVAERPLVKTLALVEPARRRFVTTLRLAPDLSPAAARRFAARVAPLREAARDQGWRLEAAGHPLLAAALDEEASRVERIFAPALAVVAFGVAWLLWSSWWLAAWTVLPAGAAVLLWRGLMLLLGWPSNLVVVAGAPVLLVVVVASLVHLVLTVRRNVAAGSVPREAVRAAWAERAGPAAIAGLTTAVGFGVFLTSDVEPTRRFGVSVAMTLVVTLPLAWLLVANGLASLPARAFPRPRDPVIRAGWATFARPGAAGRRATLGAAFVVTGAGIMSAFALSRGGDAIDYFPRTHPLRESFEALSRDGAPVSSIELLARRAEPWTAAALESVRWHEAEPGVLSPGLVVADTAAAIGGSPNEWIVGRALRRAGRLSKGGHWARWTVPVGKADPESLAESIVALTERARRDPALAGAEIVVEGTVVRLLAMQRNLVATLATSLLLTFAVSSLLFACVSRGLPALLGAVLANLTPVAAVFVALAAFDWPLDGASVMVAAVVMGLAVDNTVHFLAAHRHALRTGVADADASSFALTRVGEAAVTSGIVVATGFAALALADFAPTSRFGLLTALGCLVALLADVVLLPACVYRRR